MEDRWNLEMERHGTRGRSGGQKTKDRQEDVKAPGVLRVEDGRVMEPSSAGTGALGIAVVE